MNQQHQSRAAEQQYEFVDAQDVQRQHAGAQDGEPEALDRRAAQLEQRLQDEHDDHWLDAIQQPGGLRQAAILHVEPGQGHDHAHGGQDETGACQQQAAPAGAALADMDHHFGGIGAGDQVGGAQQVQEFLFAEPAAAENHFVVQHGDVRGRAAEGRETQAQKEQRQLSHG